MIITNKRKEELDIVFNGIKMECVEHERFLGVILDDRLSWSHHISQLSAKISRNAGILYKVKGIVPNSVLKCLYNSFIQSHLNYCSTVWGLGTKNSINKLFVAQKKAVRAIENGNNMYFDPVTKETPCHTKQIFERNKILTIHNLIAKNCLVLMHRIRLQALPLKISNLFYLSTANRPRRDIKFFEVPFARLKSSENSIFVKGPKMYNSIINEIDNNEHTSDHLKVRNTFLNRFKNIVTLFLLDAQKTGASEIWTNENFIIHKSI